MAEETTFVFTRGFNPDAATKSLKLGEFCFGMIAEFMGCLWLCGTRKGVLDSNKHEKSIRPEMGIKVGTIQHHTEGVTKSLVGTLNGAILMRTASAGELNIVTKLFK
jgi:hypothetical protein